MLNLNKIHIKRFLSFIYLFLLLGGRNFACCYCEGKKESSGLLRTVKSLPDWYLKYVEDIQQYKNMQIYKNVVGPCLLQKNLDTLINDTVPPPEPHLSEHIVTQVTDVLMAEEFTKNYLLSKTVTRYEFNGGGYDGPNCHKVLSCLDELTYRRKIDENGSHILKYEDLNSQQYKHSLMIVTTCT